MIKAQYILRYRPMNTLDQILVLTININYYLQTMYIIAGLEMINFIKKLVFKKIKFNIVIISIWLTTQLLSIV